MFAKLLAGVIPLRGVLQGDFWDRKGLAHPF